jgi:putative ABC transport system ATP-binding protein
MYPNQKAIPEQNTIIVAKDLSKVYQMGEVEVNALREVSLEIFEGELIVILGPSGSGKSTLLNIIGGMDTPTSGELFYRGSPLHNASPNELTQYRRNAVGFVFQFYNLMPNLTACENISLSVQIAESPLSIEETLDKVGLSGRADHFPSQLSGGEQQRIALARAVAKNPDLLLCDEPTGALDLETGIQVLQLLREFCECYQKTVIIITHNTEIAQMADRVLYLRDGRLSRIEVNESPVPPERVTW